MSHIIVINIIGGIIYYSAARFFRTVFSHFIAKIKESQRGGVVVYAGPRARDFILEQMF